MKRLLLFPAVLLLLVACSSNRESGTPGNAASRAIPPATSSGSAEEAPFRDVAEAVGLVFRHNPGLSGELYLPEIMGAGVALFDFDADGDLDVFLLQGASFTGKPAGGSRLFRNELVPGGKLKFTDVSSTSGIDYTGYGMGVATGDYDNDGHIDLYITSFGSNALYRNNGDGSFRNVTNSAGVDDNRWSSSAMFFDYNNDGWLDLYIANYVDFTPSNNKPCYSQVRERDYCSPKVYRAVPDRLLKNLGNGRFADVTEEAGLLAAYGPGLGVSSIDVNGDGHLDIYVANDGQPNQLWLNDGKGGFQDNGLMSATAVNANGQAEAGMGIAVGDFDSDGDEDIFVTNLARETNTLYRNDGTGMFEDATERVRLSTPSFLLTAFGTQWFDFDNDGRLDLFTANGGVTIDESRRGKSDYPYEQRNQLFRNELAPDGGLRFAEMRGGDLELLEVSRGAAFGDLDRDGDLDVVVSNNNGPARLLLNEQKAGNHWLTVRLAGRNGNRYGLGARVGVRRKDGTTLWRRVHSDGSYLSANGVDVHFGIGKEPGPVAIEVEWLGGKKQSRENVAVDQVVTVRQ